MRSSRTGAARARRYAGPSLLVKTLFQDAETRKYRLGPRVLDLGFSAINSMGVREISAPYLRQLSDDTGYTVTISSCA